ncbi:hypothetical protein DFH09DRAFT_1138948 [Mycena vulgaris]|nr:hypothetical protein DFH09DRAFT_1138948 [Mycena vulgaris]
MTRFERWVQAIGDPDIPQGARTCWKTVVHMIQTDNYLDEDWVAELYAAIKALVSELIEVAGQGLYVESDSTCLKEGVKSDKTLCIMKETNPASCLSGVPLEFKQDSTFFGNLGTYTQGPNPIHSAQDLGGGSAIMAKTNPPPLHCSYGAVFSGTYIVLVEWVEEVAFTWTKGMRHSPILDVGSMNATVPLIALLIAMLLPPDIVPLEPIDRQSQAFKNVEEAICFWSRGDQDGSEDVGGDNPDGDEDGGGDAPDGGQDRHGGGGGDKQDGGGGSGRKKRGRASSPVEDNRAFKRSTRGGRGNAASHPPSGTGNSLEVAIKAASAMAVKFDGGAEHLDCPVYTVAEALKLITGKARHHRSSALQSGDKTLTVNLSRPLPSQLPDTVWRGVVGNHPVVLKQYHARQFDKLANELGTYKCLAKLRPKVVACHGIIAAPDLSWMALLMEDSGLTVASGGGWAALPWSESRSLFQTFLAIHLAGVEHCDIAARNVLIPPWGGTSVADFGEARLNHCCEGWACPELQELRRLLGGE